MKVLAGTCCSVRSTVVIVLLLVGAFISLHSYNWRLLSGSWSRLDFLSYTPALEDVEAEVSSLAPGSSKADDSVSSTGGPSAESFENSESLDFPSNGIIVENLITSENRPTPQNDAVVPKPSPLQTDDHSEASRNEEASVVAENSSGLETGAISASEAAQRKDQYDRGAGAGSPPKEEHQEAEHVTEAKNNLEDEDRLTIHGDFAASNRKRHRYDNYTSLQKLELSLWLARSTLRKIVLAQANSSTAAFVDQSLAADEPSGDVYRNAAIFRGSYREMEKRLKIFAYPEGEEPLVHNGPCKEIYAVEGRFIQELQGDNPFLTYDPEAAHVFFLPFSVSNMVTYLYTPNSGDMSPLLRFAKDYVDVVSRKYPYWKRSDGADHFMLSCHDWGPHISRAEASLGAKSIRVLCNANVSEGYIPTKDVSLPEIHLVGGEIPAELGGLPLSQRSVLAFFAGGDHGPVRPALFQSWEGKDADILVYHQVPSEGKSYHEYMKSSKYCLCPGGYEVNSPRIVESIYNECVPVIIADNFVLPFSDVLDWTKFAIFVLEKDIPNLKTILQEIQMEVYTIMQGRLKQVRRHFLINQPPERYDTFHMILHSVWLRRLNMKILQ